jgi:uncharacterized protein YoxC
VKVNELTASVKDLSSKMPRIDKVAKAMESVASELQAMRSRIESNTKAATQVLSQIQSADQCQVPKYSYLQCNQSG